MVVAVSAVHVDWKVVIAYVYASAEGSEDIEWAKATASDWVKATLAANPKKANSPGK